MIELIIIVSLVILISAGCSLFEAVLYAVPRRHLELMLHENILGAKRFKRLKDNVDRPITAILALNTIANTAGAAFAGSVASAIFGYHWIGYFSALLTFAILIFSEIIPKTVGVVYARFLVSNVACLLTALVWIMSPAIWLSSFITRLIAKGQSDEEVTAEEIMAMARSSFRSGGIKSYQQMAIENILTLNEKMAKDVMTPRTVIFSLNENMTVEEAGNLDIDWEHSRFPVYDEDIEDIVGIVFTKELFMALARGKKGMFLTELICPVHFVVETAPLNMVLMDFLKLRQHLFMVLDEYGGLAGLISLEDILEAIIGREIVDESDQVADKRELARQRRKQLVPS